MQKPVVVVMAAGIGSRIEKLADTEYVFQNIDDIPKGFNVPAGRIKPWGTGHAVMSCRNVVRPFVVINADDFYGHFSFQALYSYLKNVSDKGGVYQYSMVGFTLENTLTEHGHVARGICNVDPKGYLEEIHERTRIERNGDSARYSEDGEKWTDIPKESIASMNIWGFTPSIFKELRGRFPGFLETNKHNILKAEYFLPEVVGELIREGKARVKVLPSKERWYGVTYKEDKPFVKQAIGDLIKQGIYPERLWGI